MGKLDIPEIKKIVNEAITIVLKRHKKSSIKELLEIKSFSEVVNEIEEVADELYREYERKAIRKYLEERNLINKNVIDVIEQIIDNSLVTSIANTRRSRAGRTVELILQKALSEAGVECEISNIKVEGYRPDITVPSDRAITYDASRCVAIAVKRTLRERWSEDIDIFKKFPNAAFVLIKPDKDFTPNKAKDMAERGMKRVYIPDVLYEKYKNELEEKFKGIFRKLSDLPNDLSKFLNKTKLK